MDNTLREHVRWRSRLLRSAASPTGTVDPFETDVQLPNINCKKCTLQIVQFMAEHGFNNPGGYSYHHCADLQIARDPAKPLATGWPAER